MISRGHLAKVRSYIELGSEEGATLLCGGLDAPALPAALRGGNFVLPTVFADVDNRMRIAQEEIFGPVACLIPFDDEADAIAHGQRHRLRPVELRLDRDIGRAHRVAAAIEAGMCFVNSQNVRDLRQPFGGTKASGTGREGGTWSYEVFCEPKNVCVSLGAHHIPHWGASESLRDAEALFMNRDAAVQRRYRDDLPALLDDYELDVEERRSCLLVAVMCSSTAAPEASAHCRHA